MVKPSIPPNSGSSRKLRLILLVKRRPWADEQENVEDFLNIQENIYKEEIMKDFIAAVFLAVVMVLPACTKWEVLEPIRSRLALRLILLLQV